MPVTRISLTISPHLAMALEDHRIERGEERSAAVEKALDRYFAILEYTRRKLAELLTDSEMGLILDVLNGTAFADTISLQLVWAEIADSLVDGYAEKWEVDGPALVEKLKTLSYAENAALVDAVERWWNRVSNGEQPPFSDALKR